MLFCLTRADRRSIDSQEGHTLRLKICHSKTVICIQSFLVPLGAFIGHFKAWVFFKLTLPYKNVFLN